ncbi:hypothetical protein [Streptomyces sp. NPDC001054]
MTSMPGDPTYTVVLKPQIIDEAGHLDHGTELRRAVVRPTGAEGTSGYPRFAGEGVEADINPENHAVEAVTVDNEELPIGWVAEALPGERRV